MENSCLNMAHQQHRRAEAHLRYRRFDEAIECHQKAADLLEEAQGLTKVTRALESIRLQREYHLKQKEIVAVKREQFENYRKAVENQRKRIVNGFSSDEYEDKQENESTSLQVAIYRTMEEADSLLGMLIRKGSESDISTTDTDDKAVSLDYVDGSGSSCNEIQAAAGAGAGSGVVSGRKHPKDDTVVIEELRTLNQQLHSLVYRLVTQLDATNREADNLRERIKFLEDERERHKTNANFPDDSKSALAKANANNLKVVTDSSGGTSPFVFSPCSEFSPDCLDSRTLPVLPDLEMPNFDFTSFVKRNSHNGN